MFLLLVDRRAIKTKTQNIFIKFKILNLKKKFIFYKALARSKIFRKTYLHHIITKLKKKKKNTN